MEGKARRRGFASRNAQLRRFKVYEKARTLRISVQDVKNVHAAKEAMENVVGVTA
ncbi:MAG: hypothetical protein JNL43_15745 [Flavobacteriales bacterium]|nr:hypothetical protein [Flavobacteriales bacterium]